jgi:hypothetical protein
MEHCAITPACCDDMARKRVVVFEEDPMSDPDNTERTRPSRGVNLSKTAGRRQSSPPPAGSMDAPESPAPWDTPSAPNDTGWSFPSPAPSQPLVPPTAPAPSPPLPGPARQASPTRQRTVLLALLALVVVGIIAVAVAVAGKSGTTRAARQDGVPSDASQTTSQLTTESTSTSVTRSPVVTDPAKSAAATATAVDRQLDRSVQARAGVQPALDRIAACEADETQLAMLRHAAAVRRELINGLRVMDLSALPNAETLRKRLTALWLYSAAADDFYVRWGDNQLGCFGEAADDEAKATGDRYSVKATAAKKAFLSLWNPIAAEYGLDQRDQAQI